MKKESLIAMILGIGAGVTIAILLISNSKSSGSSDKKVITPAVSPTVAILQHEAFTLKISSPATNSTSESDEIEIKGSAPKGSLIVITSSAGDQTIKNEEGAFEAKFPLALGENVIRITAYNGKDSTSKTLKIYQLGSE